MINNDFSLNIGRAREDNMDITKIKKGFQKTTWLSNLWLIMLDLLLALTKNAEMASEKAIFNIAPA